MPLADSDAPRDVFLSDFEELIGKKLPGPYREFLLIEGGETPPANSFLVCDGKEEWETDVSFFGLQTGAYRLYSVPVNFYEYHGRIPKHLIPIGSDSGGNLICISISEETFGQIYFSDHDYFSYDGEEPTDHGTWLLASSFPDFFNNLRVSKET
jgi:hypothetical protein